MTILCSFRSPTLTSGMHNMLRISGDQWGTEGATTGVGPESGIVDGESPSISLPYIDKESTNVRIQMQSCIY